MIYHKPSPQPTPRIRPVVVCICCQWTDVWIFTEYLNQVKQGKIYDRVFSILPHEGYSGALDGLNPFSQRRKRFQQRAHMAGRNSGNIAQEKYSQKRGRHLGGCQRPQSSSFDLHCEENGKRYGVLTGDHQQRKSLGAIYHARPATPNLQTSVMNRNTGFIVWEEEKIIRYWPSPLPPYHPT